MGVVNEKTILIKGQNKRQWQTIRNERHLMPESTLVDEWSEGERLYSGDCGLPCRSSSSCCHVSTPTVYMELLLQQKLQCSLRFLRMHFPLTNIRAYMKTLLDFITWIPHSKKTLFFFFWRYIDDFLMSYIKHWYLLVFRLILDKLQQKVSWQLLFMSNTKQIA